MKLSHAVWLACVGALAAATACTAKVPVVAPPSRPAALPVVSFIQVKEIFDERCLSCHSARKAKGGLRLDTYELLMKGGDSGEVIVPGQSPESLLVRLLEGKARPRMPYREHPLPQEQIALVRRWVEAGARAPAAGEIAPSANAAVAVPDVKPTVPVLAAAASIAFDPSGARMAAGAYRAVHIMDVARREWVARLDGHADLVRAVTFSPDGKWVAAAGGQPARFGEIKIWDAATGALVRTIRGHVDSIYAIAFSPSGDRLASGSYDRLVKIWDPATGQEVRTLKEHSDAVFAVGFMPGGTRVVSAAGDRTIKIWDLASGRRLFTISDPLDAVYALAIHPRGTEIAAGGADRIVRTWTWSEGATGAPVAGAPSARPVRAGVEATLRRSTFAHGDAVLRLAYSSDGATLVSTGADRIVKLWDADTLREKRALDIQPDWVMGLALSADGKWLALGRYDGSVGLYDLSAGVRAQHFTVPGQ
jgi:mono/diheme cytochrome c family protein